MKKKTPEQLEVSFSRKLSPVRRCFNNVFSNGVHHSKVIIGLGALGFLLLIVQLNLSTISGQTTLRYQRDIKISEIIKQVSKDFKDVHKTMPRELRSMFNFENYSDVPREQPFQLTEERIISDLLSAEHPEEETLKKAMSKKKGFDLKASVVRINSLDTEILTSPGHFLTVNIFDKPES
jgi:hypothetical protein